MSEEACIHTFRMNKESKNIFKRLILIVFFNLTYSKSGGDISNHEAISVLLIGSVLILMTYLVIYYINDMSIEYSFSEILISSPFLPPNKYSIAFSLVFSLSIALNALYFIILGLLKNQGIIFDLNILLLSTLSALISSIIFYIKKIK